MHIKTILNRVENLKGFVYGEARLEQGERGPSLLVEIRPRKGSRGLCSVCGVSAPGYDTLGERRFEYVPMWGFLVFFVYVMRRVNCPACGVKVERVPWADGKSPITTRYGWFLAGWAKSMAWSAVAEAFHTSWHSVAEGVKMAVAWGRAHMNVEGITAIGVDEIAWAKGHVYATVVYQIDAGARRLLWIGQKRTAKTLLGFFRWLGRERTARVGFVCSDMWKPYLKVIAKKVPQAIHVLDRFHIVSHVSKALDKVRASEARQMHRQGLEPVLSHSRWCLLKRTANLTQRQGVKLKDLLQYNLRTVRAYLLKEELHQFWEYVSPHWAGRFLDAWCTAAMRSRIEPMQGVARMLRRHRELILNWFRARKEFSSGIVEGLNNKAKLAMRMAYGYRSFEILEIVLYHRLGELPEPEFAHRLF
ncbi:MAG: ISL3 family transposase [bacterium]